MHQEVGECLMGKRAFAPVYSPSRRLSPDFSCDWDFFVIHILA